jgi:cytochrome b561
MTLAGWAFASVKGWQATFLGLVPLPALVDKGSPYGRTIAEWHGAIGTLILCAVTLHALAALHHRFILKDRVLQRMLPGISE